MSMAFVSPSLFHLPSLSPYSSSKSQLTHKPYLSLRPKKLPFLISPKVAENGAGAVQASAAAVEDQNAAQKIPESSPAGPDSTSEMGESSAASNGSPATIVAKFQDPRWVGGTWDVKQFQKDGKTDWDAVIDAEVRRRKWLEDDPQSSSNDDPVVFDTSIIPWWAWIKRFHLPEAEVLNGRAAMVGFFMAYFVDSLTGLGLVDQMNNFFCKTLLLVAVVGVLLIRKNEDIETLKKLLEETTFYDKQWQATWKDETTGSFKND